jgi:hypothetical protein
VNGDPDADPALKMNDNQFKNKIKNFKEKLNVNF